MYCASCVSVKNLADVIPDWATSVTMDIIVHYYNTVCHGALKYRYRNTQTALHSLDICRYNYCGYNIACILSTPASMVDNHPTGAFRDCYGK